MISCFGITRSSFWKALAHLKAWSKRHKADKEFFGAKNGSCSIQPFLNTVFSNLGYYEVVRGLLPPFDEDAFRKMINAKDPWGRQRKGTVAYHVIASPSDRVQGFFHAVEDPKLVSKLLTAAHWTMLRPIAAELGGCLVTAPHSDTARFHTEMLFPKYDLDGNRLRRGFTWDNTWLSCLASRQAADLGETRFRMEEPRWNTTIAMSLEHELLALCREFFVTHGLDQSKAAEATIMLQSELRAAKGKAEARQRQAKKPSSEKSVELNIDAEPKTTATVPASVPEVELAKAASLPSTTPLTVIPEVAALAPASEKKVTTPATPIRQVIRQPRSARWEELTKELVTFHSNDKKRAQPSASWIAADDGWPRLAATLAVALAAAETGNDEASEFKRTYGLYLSARRHDLDQRDAELEPEAP
jgi:hypothetical protein